MFGTQRNGLSAAQLKTGAESDYPDERLRFRGVLSRSRAMARCGCFVDRRRALCVFAPRQAMK
jgi:hypothetical protein